MSTVESMVAKFVEAARTGLGTKGMDELDQLALKVAFAAGLKAGGEAVERILLGEGDAFMEVEAFYRDAEAVVIEAVAVVHEMAGRN